MRILVEGARRLSHPHFRAYASHVAQKIACLTIGRLYVSSFGQKLRQMAAVSTATHGLGSLRLAVVVHAHYPELLYEALACLRILPPGTPLLVTVTPERRAHIDDILNGVARTTVYEAPNRGRDIGPFIMLLNSGALDGFDAILKLHTKRSPHLRDGDIRRRLLYLMLCGERNATLRSIAAFRDPSVGLVGWGACFRTARPYWMANRLQVASLAQRMAAGDSARLGFFEGTMFWCRPAAFASLRSLALQTDDFEPEQGQTDGSLHHAIERCFTIAAWSAGYTVRDLKGRLLTGGEVAGERAQPAVPSIGDCSADNAPL